MHYFINVFYSLINCFNFNHGRPYTFFKGKEEQDDF